MDPIYYIDRATGQKKQELVLGEKALAYLYGGSSFGHLIQTIVSKSPLVSKIYGFFQNLPLSKGKVAPFIKKYHIDTSIFEKKVEDFTSFNDFFIRKLKKSARPIDPREKTAVLPADGRFLFFPNITLAKNFIVKGATFNLGQFLNDEKLAKQYENGSLILGRLCPVDYHRFHFPVAGVPGPARLINGYLYSVNPVAIKQNIGLLYQNKRYLTEIESDFFGKVLLVEIGATMVGKIDQTYIPGTRVSKGDEKGYFAFGGSAVAILFEKERLVIDEDLLKNEGIETLCTMGESLGIAPSVNTF